MGTVKPCFSRLNGIWWYLEPTLCGIGWEPIIQRSNHVDLSLRTFSKTPDRTSRGSFTVFCTDVGTVEYRTTDCLFFCYNLQVHINIYVRMQMYSERVVTDLVDRAIRHANFRTRNFNTNLLKCISDINWANGTEKLAFTANIRRNDKKLSSPI